MSQNTWDYAGMTLERVNDDCSRHLGTFVRARITLGLGILGLGQHPRIVTIIA